MQISLQLRKWVSTLWLLPFLVVSTGHLNAQDNALQEPITLSISNTHLDTVVQAIAGQSKLIFSYDRSRLAGIKIASVKWHLTPLRNVLADLNALTGLEYVVNNGTLAIK